MLFPLHVEGLHSCGRLSADRLQIMRCKGSLDVVWCGALGSATAHIYGWCLNGPNHVRDAIGGLHGERAEC